LPRVHLVDKALYACDELAGLITAAALVRPSGITDLAAGSVKKKMKALFLLKFHWGPVTDLQSGP
jgi:predicted hydrolase (HD superfamily)